MIFGQALDTTALTITVFFIGAVLVAATDTTMVFRTLFGRACLCLALLVIETSDTTPLIGVVIF